ncbi:unnamed protein product [Brugia timori]|uniref:Reverse transcriptase n=1 Tax=Brugia timori TaxID=42155 RepID=A0A0R3QQG8_9BILA|nr:unnamed protein product [Brugia timori]
MNKWCIETQQQRKIKLTKKWDFPKHYENIKLEGNWKATCN